jgi:hypothetical protein
MSDATADGFDGAAAAASGGAAMLWRGLERRFGAADPARLRLHGLGPIAAGWLRRRRETVPDDLQLEERAAAAAMLAVEPLLTRVRAACDGPLLLMKGPEIAVRYPNGARAFGDVDLLALDARSVHRQLRAAGFVEVGDPRLFHGIHHLRPLSCPRLPLVVEIHSKPKWLDRLPPPPVAEIFDTAVPARVGVDGVLAASPERHALLVAAHAWAHEPLCRLRDLVDVAAVAADADPGDIDRLADELGAGRLWRTTCAAVDAVLLGGRVPLAVRLWARHLSAARERTVLEAHVQELVSGYWALPPGVAFAQTRRAVARDLLPAPEETWTAKLSRTIRAWRNAVEPISKHDSVLGDAARRGQWRNPPDEA